MLPVVGARQDHARPGHSGLGLTRLLHSFNRCIEAGINFFDTANMYQAGVAETMLGHAIKSRRDHLIIASKVFFKMGDDADQQGLSRRAILRAIDESLTRLGTDYLDLYYFHAPDHDIPIDESMEAMESLIKQLNHRIKGTEQFWNDGGLEAVLQVRAAYLSQDDRADALYEHRARAPAVGRHRLKPFQPTG